MKKLIIFYLNDFYIPCTNEITGEIEYKSLASDSIYLKELDKAFLSMIKEKKDNNILIQIKSDITKYNMEFWNKFYVNDIKDGLKTSSYLTKILNISMLQ